MARRTRLASHRRSADTIRARLDTLTRNLWWTWNSAAQRLMAAIEPRLWNAHQHNPIALLKRLPAERLAELEADSAFGRLLRDCERQWRAYRADRGWFARTAGRTASRMRVAYFCAEFALHESMPQYSGGLGVLAGDHLKAASDLGVPLVGVGLLYRSGYYRQSLAADGSTVVSYPRYDFADFPLHDTGQTVAVPIGRRAALARIWRVDVGRTPLYLLDTDVTGNPPSLRLLTDRLYGGDSEHRIAQELLLGVGGVRALAALKLRPTVYHLNEGHAAFCTLERLRELRSRRRSPAQALDAIRRSTVFTTHTPVPAGHDRFERRLVRSYLGPLAEQAGMDVESLLRLGRERPDDRGEPLCMTVLALRLAGRANGVSRIHGRVSREMWRTAQSASGYARTAIGHVTNGVHSRTWLAPEIEPLYERYLRPRWVGAGPRDDPWKRAARIPPAEWWRARNLLRKRLVAFARQRLRQQAERRLGDGAALAAAADALRDDALTIGFARRFATYKRAPLIFSDARRLAAILSARGRPVQVIFAGKAHPADRGGQAFAQQVFRHTLEAHFGGRVVFIEEYDMEVGRMLVSGCDVWLNNPVPPHEASGTSGMKPPLHGGLNCSIADGWWPEAATAGNGWTIPSSDKAPIRLSAGQRDRRDAAALYDLLERQIVPLFYARGADGLPRGWLKRSLRSMQTIGQPFSAARMVGDYVRQYYLPAHSGADPS